MKKTRILAMILSFAMVFTLAFPVGVFADELFSVDDFSYDDLFASESDFAYDNGDFIEEPFIQDWYDENEWIEDQFTEDADLFFEDAIADEPIIEEFFEEELPLDEEQEAGDTETDDEFADDEQMGEFFVSDMDSFTAEVFAIVEEPVDFEVEVGGTATFHVEATGVASYQWQFHNGKIWQNTSSVGAKTDTITVECNETRYNYKYRCVLTGNDGSTLMTDEVKMVKPASFVENDVRYAILGNGNVSVEKYLGNESNVIIPSAVRNYNVTEIGEEAFMNQTTLQSIDLPDSITVIRARAFKGCTSLSEMK